MGEPVLVPFGGGEIIGDSPERRVEILSDDQLLHATWSRFGPGREGADLHVHSDLFYVLEGELTVRLGIQDEPVVVSAGTLARVPPYVVHGFRNGSDAEVRYLNFHAPGQGFADFLRALGDGRAFSYDQHPPPSDGSRPPSEAVVGGEAIVADQPGLRVALLADVEEIGISEVWSDPGRPAPPPHIHRRHLESFYVLEGGLTFRAGDAELRARPGSWVQVPPGVPHTFADAGSDAVRFLNLHTPNSGFDPWPARGAHRGGTGVRASGVRSSARIATRHARSLPPRRPRERSAGPRRRSGTIYPRGRRRTCLSPRHTPARCVTYRHGLRSRRITPFRRRCAFAG